MFIFKTKINYRSNTIVYIFICYQLIIMKRELYKIHQREMLVTWLACGKPRDSHMRDDMNIIRLRFNCMF